MSIDDPWRGRPPKPGDRVRWSQTGTEWFVVSVDNAREVATIRERLLGRINEFQAVWAELGPVALQSPTNTSYASPLPVRRRASPRLRAVPYSADTDIDEEPDDRSPVERIVDRLLFSENVLRAYHREYAPPMAYARCARHLRWLLRKHGVLCRRSPGEYIRLRLKGRFDAVVKERPSSEEEPYMVTTLHPLGRNKATRQRGRRSRAKRKAA